MSCLQSPGKNRWAASGKQKSLPFDADPTKDIHNTRRINSVLLDGRLLRRVDLDALLEAAAEKNAAAH